MVRSDQTYLKNQFLAAKKYEMSMVKLENVFLKQY